MADVTTRLILETEGARDAEKSIAGLIDVQDKLNKSIRDSVGVSGKATKETDKLVEQYKDAITAEKELRDAVNRTNDEFGDRRKVLEANEQFNRTSEGVSLAGDAESQLRTLGGAAGAFGFEGVERGISQVAEIPAVIEALPRLKEAFAGLPGAIGQAASALGPAGIAFAAFAAAALLIFSELDKEAQKIAETFDTGTEAQRRYNQEIQAGILTTEEANRRLEEITASRKAEELTLQQLQKSYDEAIEGQGLLTVALKTGNRSEEARFAAIQESEELIKGYTQDQEGLNQALDSGALATADAIEAERELASLRLDEASFAGELAELQARSSEFSQDQIDSALRQIELQEIRLEAERESLESLDEQTDETTERIEKLNEELDKLGEKSEVLENTEPVLESEKELSATRQESTKVNKEAMDAERAKTEETRKAEQQTRKLEQAQQKAQQAQDRYTQAVDNAGTAFDNALDDIDQDLKDSFLDTQSELRDELADLERDFNRDALADVRDHKRDLKKINIDEDRGERDALRTRNFLALSEARDDAQEARDDASVEFQQEGEERLIEAQDQRTDIVNEARRETRELKIEANRQARDASIQRDRSIIAAQQQLNIQEQALRASIEMLQQWGKSFVQIQQQAFSAVGTGGTSDSNTLLQLVEQQRFGST